MMFNSENDIKLTIDDHPMADIIRTDRIPWIFCSGCMIGSEIQLTARAIKELEAEGKINRNDIVVVSGIGCSGRASGYFNLDGFHSTHGRAIPLATGIKSANHKLKVIVFSGDGDLFSIGGNHLIHAARRNIDLTVICINNHNYGMTGGQSSAGTPVDSITTTTPFGNFYEPPFNFVSLTANSGATYVSRYTSIHTKEIVSSVKKAIMHKGFSFIEVVSPCPTYYGKMNNMKVVKIMADQLKKLAIIRDKTPPHEAIIDYQDKIVCGEFVNIEKPEYIDRFNSLKKRVEEKNGKPKDMIDYSVLHVEKIPEQAFRHEILLAGMGGQGLVTSGTILAQASILYEGINATQSQNYGPESRGGLSYSEVILSNKKIHYPKTIRHPYVLVTLTEESFKKFTVHLTETKHLIIDPDLLQKIDLTPYRKHEQLNIYEVQFTKEAYNMGNKVIANIIVLGFVSKILDMNPESVIKAIKSQFKSKEKLIPLNIKAFERGRELWAEVSKKHMKVSPS